MLLRSLRCVLAEGASTSVPSKLRVNGMTVSEGAQLRGGVGEGLTPEGVSYRDTGGTIYRALLFWLLGPGVQEEAGEN